MIEVKCDKQVSSSEAIDYTKEIIDKITPRFTKTYNYLTNEKLEQEGFYRYLTV
jgi:hypothetical protein